MFSIKDPIQTIDELKMSNMDRKKRTGLKSFLPHLGRLNPIGMTSHMSHSESLMETVN